MVSGTISPSSSECFSPFPHGTGTLSTGTLSVSREYLALPDGPGGFAQDYSCPALLRIPKGLSGVRVRGSHPLRRAFPGASTPPSSTIDRSYYPGRASPRGRFGLLPGRSPLLGESLLFSSPAGTKMFQFPAFASTGKKPADSRPAAGWVVPFGNPRINGHLHLPAAYRSLSRPSSPP